MSFDQENSPERVGNWVCSSLELYYQMKNDSITKHPSYVKAMEMLKEHEDNLKDEPEQEDSNDALSLDFLQSKFMSTEQQLRESESELKIRLEQPNTNQVTQMLNFDLTTLSNKVAQVKTSVDNLNRNIDMMRNNFGDNCEDVIPVDEEKLNKANRLVDNLLKLTRRDFQ